MEPQGLSDSRSSSLIVVSAVIALAVSLVVLVRTHGGWRSHVEPSGTAPILQLDPNTASWQELAALPRIGPAVAQRIVEHREQARKSGATRPFADSSDLDKIPGIGPRTLEELRPYLVYE